ncbi:rhomboid-like protein [Streptomyces sp. NPDC020681]|uniref:rhomboid-like protein n=1 Tax=Streptomyces sp. NPDC020681 TaxID=3365083 RepID=UPI00378B9BB6
MHRRTKDEVPSTDTGLLPGIPRQRKSPVEPAAESASPEAGLVRPVPSGAAEASCGGEAQGSAWRRGWAVLRQVVPTPTGTPFTFAYILVLIATSLFAEYGDPATVSALLRGSSTDVAHLADTPLLVLGASALWVAGGLASPYAVAFLFTLTALERRIGGLRTAGVFFAGHVMATLATEIPVGISVAAGHLPATSLHRLDYGISFGLMASIGALAGLLGPVPRATLLGFTSLMLLKDLLAFADPLTNWGHPLALLAGLLCWPAVRRVARHPLVLGERGEYVPQGG